MNDNSVMVASDTEIGAKPLTTDLSNVRLDIKRYIVVTECGHWGLGITLAEAAQKALSIGARKTSSTLVFLILNDTDPGFDGWNVCYDSRAKMIRLGRFPHLGNLSKVINQE